MPRASELSACLDGTGVLNLTKLHDLVIDSLMKIQSARAGSGRRTKRSLARFRQHVVAFLVKTGLFESNEAAQWYTSNPGAEWQLIENADSAI